ncbi:MAG: enolase C-terminal domain-like protein [Planctomycetaceae bacterium]
MRIHRLTAFQVPIALKKPVRHASHERRENETLILRCVLDDGSCGWGEGLPRPYVTGESINSVWRHLEQTDFSSLREATFSSARDASLVIDQFLFADVATDPGIAVRECFGNSVRCALELAILDAACRAEEISLSDFILQHPAAIDFAKPCDGVFYSGAVTSMTPRSQWISALKMKLFAFRQVKVKVGTAGISDVDVLRRVRRIVGSQVDLRLDANEAWHCDEVASKVAPLMPFRSSSLEQPVPHSEVAGLRQVRSEVSVPIMLDESLCCQEDAERAIAGETCDLFNIRLSKCGGISRSLGLVALARQHGMGYQLGCQVGETGILSAAGRHFACNVPDIRYLEGSFDRFLVRESLTEQDLTFRYGGKGTRLHGHGLSIDVNECRVRELAVRTLDIIAP